jgi:tetratricopeptide (TPR) repeat protein
MNRSMINAALGAFLSLQLALAGAARADEAFDALLKAIQDGWAVANYRTDGKEAKNAAFEKLAAEAAAFSAKYPGRAEPLIWEGIVLSTWAGARGGLGALGLAKDSRAKLEAALKIDEKALGGSAHTSIGTLYHKVPGFPVGFGSDKKAKDHLQKALQMNPEGIDPNFFYGEFLYDEGEYQDALKHLSKALQAPARPGRELADEGRRGEIRALMAKTRDELS